MKLVLAEHLMYLLDVVHLMMAVNVDFHWECIGCTFEQVLVDL